MNCIVGWPMSVSTVLINKHLFGVNESDRTGHAHYTCNSLVNSFASWRLMWLKQSKRRWWLVPKRELTHFSPFISISRNMNNFSFENYFSKINFDKAIIFHKQSGNTVTNWYTFFRQYANKLIWTKCVHRARRQRFYAHEMSWIWSKFYDRLATLGVIFTSHSRRDIMHSNSLNVWNICFNLWYAMSCHQWCRQFYYYT